MMDIVERVARAMVAELARQDGVEGATWVLENGRLAFLDQENPDMFAVSRAAIEAMRECSGDMISAGAIAGDLPDRAAKEVWADMIDAALEEGS